MTKNNGRGNRKGRGKDGGGGEAGWGGDSGSNLTISNDCRFPSMKNSRK